MDLNHGTEVLQLLGWVLTVMGQAQITAKRKSGFGTWLVANVVLIALNLTVGLYWSAAMFGTNFLFCVWSYGVWSREERSKNRRLFYRGALR